MRARRHFAAAVIAVVSTAVTLVCLVGLVRRDAGRDSSVASAPSVVEPAGTSQPPGARIARMSPSSEPEPAEVVTHRVEKPERVPQSGIRLEPPPANYEPSVSESDALELSRSHAFGADLEKSHPVARLASYTNEDIRPVEGENGEGPPGPLLYENVPMWVVTYDEACVPVYGPPELREGLATRPCASSEINVVLDADTGEYIHAYSYQ